MPIFSKSSHRFEPNLFKPKGKTPRLMTREFLAEASRQLTEFKKIEERHESEIRAYLSKNPHNTNGLTEQAWRNVFVVEMISQLGKPERFDFEFDEICKEHRTAAESDKNFSFGKFFADTAIVCSITPLYKTIWSMQGWLDTAYRQPMNPTDAPEFDVMLLSFIEQDAALLESYLGIFNHLGEDKFLAVIGTGEPDQKV